MHSYLFFTLLKCVQSRLFGTAQAEGDKSTNGVGMHNSSTFPSENSKKYLAEIQWSFVRNSAALTSCH